jgi:multidrug efflux pump subunit AcrA (membrane-fusion protein)
MKQVLTSLAFVLLLAACKHTPTVKPQRKNIVDAVFGSGHLENTDQYSIMANAEGYVKASYVKEGDTVNGGQQLFRLSNDVQLAQVANAQNNLDYARISALPHSPQIEQLQIQIAQAAQKVQLDSSNYARYSRLVKTQAVSTMDYDNAKLTYQSSLSNLQVLQKNLADLQRNVDLNLKNAKAQYDVQQQNNNYYVISANAPGIIMNVAKKTGDYVKKGESLALIGAGAPVIKLYIAEEDIHRVQLGQLALISLNSLKDTVLKATITKIYPGFNTTEQSFIAEATFQAGQQTGPLMNGTQLQANIIIGEKKNALVIPSYYLMNGNYVLRKGEKEKTHVQTGITTLEWTEITGGLTENDELTLPKQQ